MCGPVPCVFCALDRNCVIREKTRLAGYILFDYPEGQKLHKGSLELIRASESSGRDITAVVASLPDLPRHFEQLLVDKLAARLREDYGSPAPRRRAGPSPTAATHVETAMSVRSTPCVSTTP